MKIVRDACQLLANWLSIKLSDPVEQNDGNRHDGCHDFHLWN
jgi:hypothetical protein